MEPESSPEQQVTREPRGEREPHVAVRPAWLPAFRELYMRRVAVEREFGRLKHEWGLARLRVRGLERVRLHADLTMLARLTLALARARNVVLAAA